MSTSSSTDSLLYPSHTIQTQHTSETAHLLSQPPIYPLTNSTSSDAFIPPTDIQAPTLKRGLEARHLIMMSVGGTIGTGLFVASGSTVGQAGPVGALVAYAREALAWTLGWNYWLQWSISLPSELSAAGIIVTFWLPSTPAWLWSLLILILLIFINTRDVSKFGESEYWLSFVKVLTVLIFIAVGLYVDAQGFPSDKEPLWFKHWTADGLHAGFKNGIPGLFSVFAIAFFAFGGTELVGISAGEVQNPRENVPRAINQTFWRILIFYVGSIFVIGVLIRHDDPKLALAAETGDIRIAPFTLILQRAGLGPAAHIMNAVILTAVVSAANSAMYAASRTLVSLSIKGHAPPVLGVVSRKGVPIGALVLTVAISCLSFLGIFLGEGFIFSWLLTLTGTSGLLTWTSITLTHLRFRKAYEAQGRRLEDLPYRVPWFPWGSYVSLFIAGVVMVGQAWSAVVSRPVQWHNVVSIFVGTPMFFALYFVYRRVKGTTWVPLGECNFDSGLDEDRDKEEERLEDDEEDVALE
ncbi:hypothetical protein HDV05_000992 [Chytridiales sp. JEL 0842]|nr:hypothetical protein HDV05_000992 [Chytridiales sp. JEL 0842]